MKTLKFLFTKKLKVLRHFEKKQTLKLFFRSRCPPPQTEVLKLCCQLSKVLYFKCNTNGVSALSTALTINC